MKKTTTSNLRRKPASDNKSSTQPKKLLNAAKPIDPILVTAKTTGGTLPYVEANESLQRWTRYEKIDFLYSYAVAYPDFVVGDDQGTLFGCMKTLLVAWLVLGTRSTEVISYVTGYPELFVSAVLSEFYRLEMHLSERCLEGEVFEYKVESVAEISDWAGSLQEWFWSAFWSYEAQIALDTLRNRVLFGGGVQDWVDIDAVYRFGLQDRVRNANGEGLASLTDTQLIVSQMKPLFGRARTAH